MNTDAGSSHGKSLTFAMTLMIASLAVLFAASLVGYWVTRSRATDGEVMVPTLLWFSTLALIAAGVLLSLATRRLHAGKAPGAHPLLRGAGVAAVVFLALQVPALLQLLAAHPLQLEAGNPLVGFVFFLILLHALHVVGGVIALGVILSRARTRGLSADHDGAAMRQTGRYWHFLDIVWVVMFLVFLLG